MSDQAYSAGVRKRMRKGTHSCFECRRRKIRCIFPSDNPNVCSECFARGSRCIDQEHADPDVIVDQRKNLRERVARLESLIESMVDGKDEGLRKEESRRSQGSDQVPLTPFSDRSSGSSSVEYSRMPYVSLLEDRQTSSTSLSEASTPPWSRYSVTLERSESPTVESEASPNQAASMRKRAKDERVRQALLAVLPPEEKLLDKLQPVCPLWGSFQKRYRGLPSDASVGTLVAFASYVLKRGTLYEVARVIQSYAVSLTSAVFEDFLSVVDRLVIDDDEYMGTLDGLELILLQGRVYSNSGQARRAWLAYRRGLCFAQLLGLHRNRTSPREEALWWNLYEVDRFKSLMLGTPYGVADASINMTYLGKAPDLSVECTIVIRLAQMVGKIIDRTQSLREATLESALSLDKELMKFAAQMSPSFWNLSPDAQDQTPESMLAWYDDLQNQLTYYHAKLVLHMPYVLKADSEPCPTYCRESCLSSARSVLKIYYAIRAEETGRRIQCGAIDFVSFTAAVVLMLSVLGYGRPADQDTEERDEKDWSLIETSMAVFKQSSVGIRGKVASHSYRALSQLAAFRNVGSNHDRPIGAKISVPFFGTIKVQRNPVVQKPLKPLTVPRSKLPTPSSRSSNSTSPPMANAAVATFTIAHGQGPPPPPPPKTLSSGSPTLHAPMANIQTSNISNHNQGLTYADRSEPSIVYDGVYMGHPSYAAVSQFAAEAMSASYLNAAGGGYASHWDSVGNLDTDQEWSWPMDGVQFSAQ